MTLDDLTPEIKAKIKQIAAQHGAFNVRIFGSVAKGEADHNSDLVMPNRRHGDRAPRLHFIWVYPTKEKKFCKDTLDSLP